MKRWISKCIDCTEKWPKMVIFQYNLYIFVWIQLSCLTIFDYALDHGNSIIKWLWSIWQIWHLLEYNLPFGIFLSCCSFSKLLKLSSRAWDIFWVVPGVRGGTWSVVGTSENRGRDLNIFSCPTSNPISILTIIRQTNLLEKCHYECKI